MPKSIGSEECMELCKYCPLSDCEESDPRCPIQIKVREANEAAGAEVLNFRTRVRQNEFKHIYVIAVGERGTSGYSSRH